MKLTPGLTMAILTLTAGALAAAGRSARAGRKVWSPGVFAWRNLFRPRPTVEGQAGCPLSLVNPRFYSLASAGSPAGPVLELDVRNVSGRAVHSYTVSHRSPEPADAGAGGWQPETLLQPGQSHPLRVSSGGSGGITFSVDFVQFADGGVWYADPPRALVKPEGVRAGALAAHEYLRETLERGGAAAVLGVLPQVRTHVDLPEASAPEAYGFFGFYCGVTKMVARVEQAHRAGGLRGGEELINVAPDDGARPAAGGKSR